MQKAIYYAIAFFLIFLTIQCVSVEKVAFRWNAPAVQSVDPSTGLPPPAKRMEYTIPDWLVWSLFTPGLLFWVYAWNSKNA